METRSPIGAPHENSSAKGINGNQNDHSLYSSGAVYVFTRRGDTVAQQAYIKASNPEDGANFGSSVALSRDGNTMAVAAYYEASAATGINGNETDHSIPEAGAVYVFTRSGTHLVAAGLHQGLEHRARPRSETVSLKATSSATRSR